MDNNIFTIGQIVCQTKIYANDPGMAASIPVAGIITKITPKYLFLNVEYGWPGAVNVPGFVALKMKKELFT